MWSIFRFKELTPTLDKDIRDKPLYKVWLTNKDGTQVMDYVMELEKLQEFCGLVSDLNFKRMADASKTL